MLIKLVNILCWSSIAIYHLFITNHLNAQTLVNPDISVVGNFHAYVENEKGNGEKDNRLQLDSPELEFDFQGYLNPYSRADIFVAKPFDEEPFEIEEAYLTLLKGLPAGLQFLAGKYLIDFGYLNRVHTHSFPFIFRPQVHRIFLGEEGLSDIGLQLNTLIPVGDAAGTLSFNVLKGGFLSREEEEHEQASGIETEENLAYSGRASLFHTFADYHHILFGSSLLTGIHDPEKDRRFWYWGFDWKYRWRPDKYRSFIFQGEFMVNRRTLGPSSGDFPNNIIPKGDISTKGHYLYVKYQFKKMFHLGVKYDWTESLDDDPDEKERAFSIFGEFSPIEETSLLRLIYERDLEQESNLFVAQIVFLLGPHKPHQF